MGTGIGLAVPQVAERHSGSVAVESQVGAGSAFWLRLPFGRVHLPPSDVLAPEAKMPAESAAGLSALAAADALALPNEPTTLATLPRLLLVEDTDEVRQYLLLAAIVRARGRCA